MRYQNMERHWRCPQKFDIFLLLPVGKGTRGSWDWATVKEVFVGQYDDSEVHFPIYVTTTGEKFGGLGSQTPVVPHKAFERVFPANRRSRRSPGS